MNGEENVHKFKLKKGSWFQKKRRKKACKVEIVVYNHLHYRGLRMKQNRLYSMILPVMHLYSDAAFHEHWNTTKRIQKMGFYSHKG